MIEYDVVEHLQEKERLLMIALQWLVLHAVQWLWIIKNWIPHPLMWIWPSWIKFHVRCWGIWGNPNNLVIWVFASQRSQVWRVCPLIWQRMKKFDVVFSFVHEYIYMHMLVSYPDKQMIELCKSSKDRATCWVWYNREGSGKEKKWIACKVTLWKNKERIVVRFSIVMKKRKKEQTVFWNRTIDKQKQAIIKEIYWKV